MRSIPAEMAERIESGAATLCHAWIMKRVDGVTVGFTDHDRDLEVEGIECRASSGWTVGAAGSEAGLSAGLSAVAGVLDNETVSEADIVAGRLDRAGIELWRVDWRRPELRVRLWAGRLARLRREGEGFFADVEGPLGALERVVGRTYGRDCDAELGDGRCRVDLASFPGETCDKRWSTCRSKFANGVNFQGFPGVPGDDFLTATPVQGGRNDGRSRR